MTLLLPSRRGFLFGAAAVLAAPAIARATSLMPVSVLRPPKLWGDGIHDDTAALQWLIDNAERIGRGVDIRNGRYRVSKPLRFGLSGTRPSVLIEDCTFLADPMLEDRPLLSLNNLEGARINNIRIDYDPIPPCVDALDYNPVGIAFKFKYDPSTLRFATPFKS